MAQHFVPGMQYQGYSPYNTTSGAQSFLPSLPTVGTVVGTALGKVITSLATSSSSTASNSIVGATFPEGADIQIDPTIGPARRTRRRRRKLLTCSDKADIAFLYGQLGGGQLGKAAISSLLSRRCS